jgi:hypothetical protein
MKICSMWYVIFQYIGALTLDGSSHLDLILTGYELNESLHRKPGNSITDLTTLCDREIR